MEEQKGYIAFVLDETSRTNLLTKYSPMYTNEIAHHVTLKYGCTEAEAEEVIKNLEVEKSLNCQVLVTDYHKSIFHGADCVSVSFYGKALREDGNKFHVTLSVDNGVKAFVSNLFVNDQLPYEYYHMPKPNTFPEVFLTGKFEFFPFPAAIPEPVVETPTEDPCVWCGSTAGYSDMGDGWPRCNDCRGS